MLLCEIFRNLRRQIVFSLSSTQVEERAGERRCIEILPTFYQQPLSLALSPRCGARELSEKMDPKNREITALREIAPEDP